MSLARSRAVRFYKLRPAAAALATVLAAYCQTPRAEAATCPDGFVEVRARRASGGDDVRCVERSQWEALSRASESGEAASDSEVAPSAAQAHPVADPDEGFTFLPNEPLFEPLSADPRWPRFAASWLQFQDDPELDSVGSVAFGGAIPIFSGPLFFGGRWELGVQGGVFSIFDLDESSKDLINTDFLIGIPISARWGWFSFMVRGYHQSSHLGDEFLLRTGTDRIDLSYEAVDALASIDLWSWGRIYGGGGYLTNRDPDDLGKKYQQAGIELTSPVAFFGTIRPIAAADTKRWEEPDWDGDYSVRAGFQFENPRFGGRRLQLLGEYYKGRNPNGQFFERRIEYWGAGVHFHY